MSNFIPFMPKRDSMAMWIICESIGRDSALVDKMQKNPDGSYPVKFEVGGVELDFSRFTERLEKTLDQMVAEKAQSLLDEKYDSLLGEVYDIQKRLGEQKNKFFQYDWEEDELK